MNANNLEQVVKQYGFDDEADFHKHIASLDLRTPELRQKFKEWQYSDGSKTGLLKLAVRAP